MQACVARSGASQHRSSPPSSWCGLRPLCISCTGLADDLNEPTLWAFGAACHAINQLQLGYSLSACPASLALNVVLPLPGTISLHALCSAFLFKEGVGLGVHALCPPSICKSHSSTHRSLPMPSKMQLYCVNPYPCYTKTDSLAGFRMDLYVTIDA